MVFVRVLKNAVQLREQVAKIALCALKECFHALGVVDLLAESLNHHSAAISNGLHSLELSSEVDGLHLCRSQAATARHPMMESAGLQPFSVCVSAALNLFESSA